MTFLNLHTCHYTLAHYANDGKCWAMNNQNEQNATCRVCPGRCSWRAALQPIIFLSFVDYVKKLQLALKTHEELLHVYFNQDEPLVSQTR